MDKKILAAQVNADYTQDQLQAQTDEQLYKLGMLSGMAANKSKSTADQLAAQHKLSLQQLEVNEKNIEVQLASSQAKIDQAKTLLALYEKQTAALEVRSGLAGELDPLAVPVSVGTHVTAGTSLAEVVQLGKLKAALQIAETQARDITIGLPASIDTHNGVIPGHVSRIDPAVLNGTRTVDVVLDGPLPPGAVKGLSVDGTIDLEKLHDVLYVGRPALGNENSTLSLFKDRSRSQGRSPLIGPYHFIGLSNYTALLHNPVFLQSIVFTLKYTAIVTVPIFVVGYALALLVRSNRRGATVFRTLIFLPFIVGLVAESYMAVVELQPSSGTVNFVLARLGIVSSTTAWTVHTGLAMTAICTLVIWFASGLTMMLLMAGMQSHPDRNLRVGQGRRSLLVAYRATADAAVAAPVDRAEPDHLGRSARSWPLISSSSSPTAVRGRARSPL